MLRDKKAIVLLNKCDKENVITEEEMKKYTNIESIISISALNRVGLDRIYEEIAKMYNFNEIDIDNSLTITNERHKQALINMKKHVEKAKETINERMPIDVVTISITDILEEIGKITGECVTEDIINEIFKKFCLGK